MTPDTTQLSAIDRAAASRFHMINGGAGTGKTTIIEHLARLLMRNRESVALCAFAGKAAARLKEATGLPTSTIHRLLKYNGVKFMAGTLEDISLIVDEASMISADLMAEIVRRKPRRIILVGDQAQLPPVGKGQPFHDLLELRPECVSTLTTCYRATEAVFHAAQLIRAGEWPGDFAQSESERWEIKQTGNADRTHRWILDIIREGAIDFDRDIILVARNGESDDTPCSVRGLNADIAAIVNPRPNGDKFLVGDRVINGKNFPDEDVWNGTTGKIHAIDSDGGVWVELDTPITDPATGEQKDKVLFAGEMRKSLSLAYALTVHKSQGSQYRNVLVVCLDRDAFALLDRSLIYTAVTRTQAKCCVVGNVSAVREGIRTVRIKRTVLQELAGFSPMKPKGFAP
jgi:exodeoxyribonuclease V alpha subunit